MRHHFLRARLRPARVLGFALAIVALATACGSDSRAEPATGNTGAGTLTTPAAGAPATPTATPPFPTGPAVTVPEDYVRPDDRVDSTGAHLPVNGKPTLVFVDAIW